MTKLLSVKWLFEVLFTGLLVGALIVSPVTVGAIETPSSTDVSVLEQSETEVGLEGDVTEIVDLPTSDELTSGEIEELATALENPSDQPSLEPIEIVIQNENTEDAEDADPPVTQPEPPSNQDDEDDSGNEDEVDNENDAEAAPSLASGVIITELQTRNGDTGAELVEIYNSSVEDIDVTGWRIQYASASTGNFNNSLRIVPEDTAPGARVLMPAKSYAVFVSSKYAENNQHFADDGRLTRLMSDDGGRLRIVDSLENEVDLLLWGKVNGHDGKTAEAIKDADPVQSLQRIKTESGYQDTDNSVADFKLSIAKTSYQTGALYEAVDLCVNIVGLQKVLPADLWRLSSGECVDKNSINLCQEIVINEIAANVPKQYVELFNNSDSQISLAGCSIMTNRNQTVRFTFDNVKLESRGHYTLYIEETSLKLTKSTNGTVFLIASDNETEVDAIYYEDLSADTSWSRFKDDWKQTYELTPDKANIFAEFAACQEGYWRNEATGRCNKTVGAVDLADCGAGRERNPLTGRCRNIVYPAVLTDCGEGRERNPLTGRCRNTTTVRTLTPCREGQYRSEETNRCRSIAAAASSLKPCADDQFRNPLTNRCKKIASVDELADCGEGRERNPETNRCRNVLAASTNIPSAPFAPEQIKQVAEGTLGWWALGGALLAAVGFGVWQWRFEMANLLSRVRQAFSIGSKK